MHDTRRATPGATCGVEQAAACRVGRWRGAPGRPAPCACPPASPHATTKSPASPATPVTLWRSRTSSRCAADDARPLRDELLLRALAQPERPLERQLDRRIVHDLAAGEGAESSPRSSTARGPRTTARARGRAARRRDRPGPAPTTTRSTRSPPPLVREPRARSAATRSATRVPCAMALRMSGTPVRSPARKRPGRSTALEARVHARAVGERLALGGQPQRAVGARLLAGGHAAALLGPRDDRDVLVDGEHVERADVHARVAAQAPRRVDPTAGGTRRRGHGHGCCRRLVRAVDAVAARRRRRRTRAHPRPRPDRPTATAAREAHRARRGLASTTLARRLPRDEARRAVLVGAPPRAGSDAAGRSCSSKHWSTAAAAGGDARAHRIVRARRAFVAPRARGDLRRPRRAFRPASDDGLGAAVGRVAGRAAERPARGERPVRRPVDGCGVWQVTQPSRRRRSAARSPWHAAQFTPAAA